MYDVLILGGGAAGLTAGLYAARAGLHTLLIEAGFPGGQAATTNRLENYPGFPEGIGGPELMLAFSEQAEHFGMETLYGTAQSLSLHGAEKSVVVDGQTYAAKSVILALGANPKKLDVVGESENIGRGVSYCATCDGALYRDKTVAVVGGGDTAVEDVLFLAQHSKVLWLHRRETLRAVGQSAAKALKHPNVTTMFSRAVASVAHAEQGLNVSLSTGETIAVSGLFVAVGTVPATECLQGILRLENGYIPAGEDTRTEIDGVFCAGDCRKKPLRQVITAASDGAVAGFMAAKYCMEA